MTQSYTYRYPRPMVTVDVVVFGMVAEGLRTLFIKRGSPPFEGCWALPGGYLEMEEEIETAARRELAEETGLAQLPAVSQIGVYGRLGRDPRGRTISVAHGAVLRGELPSLQAGDDAGDAAWLDPSEVGTLAFDHAEILNDARRWLVQGVSSGDLILGLLPLVFTNQQLRHVLGKTTGSRRRASSVLGRLVRTGRVQSVGQDSRTYQTILPPSV